MEAFSVMQGFKVVVLIEVTFRDTDAMRHANNAVYLTWFENGRIGYWRAMTEPHGEQADYAAVPFVLARAEIEETRRAEEIDVAGFVRMANALTSQ